MRAIVGDGGLARMDDLHIDKIDNTWKARESWIRGGLEAFRLALILRERLQLPFAVALGFSLKSGEHFTGINFRNIDELGEKLDWTAPSLYLFQAGETPKAQTLRAIKEGVVHHDADVRDLEHSIFGSSAMKATCYYLEFRQIEADDYSRSVFLES